VVSYGVADIRGGDFRGQMPGGQMSGNRRMGANVVQSWSRRRRLRALSLTSATVDRRTSDVQYITGRRMIEYINKISSLHLCQSVSPRSFNFFSENLTTKSQVATVKVATVRIASAPQIVPSFLARDANVHSPSSNDSAGSRESSSERTARSEQRDLVVLRSRRGGWFTLDL